MTAAATASRRRRRHQPQPAQQRELSAAACCASIVLPVHGGSKDVAEHLCTTMECRRTQEQIESEALPESFCIIESRDSVKVLRCGSLHHTDTTHETCIVQLQCMPCALTPVRQGGMASDTGSQCRVQNFAKMQLSEIEDNIVSRRNRIFLLMEEVRRLRIQRRLKVKAPTQVPLSP